MEKTPGRSDLRVIGVDPGSRITGYAILSAAGKMLKPIDYGVIRLNPKEALSERLLTFAQIFESILQKHKLDAMAIEGVFTAKNVKSILKLGQVRGIAIMLAAKHAVEIAEYSPATVKQGIVGYGRATKDQVQYMVQKILHLKTPPEPKDVSDALAIGICHLNHMRLKRKTRRFQ